MTMTRILVVEPDAAERRRYTGWLRTEGFEVEAAKNERDALDALKRDRSAFDLVLANVKPRGHAFIDQLLAVRSDLPVVCIAADNRSSVAAIERGAWHCLVPPIEQELLQRLIVHLLKLRAQRSTIGRARPGHPRPSAATVSATDAKNEFASILDTAVKRGPVFITKHDAPRAVLLGLDEYQALTSAPNERLSALTTAFDELLDRMQAPGARARMQAAFDASPDALAEAAVRAARQG